MCGKVRKVISVILCLCLLACLCGCGKTTPKNGDKIEVVTTIFPLYDFVRAVGGDRVEIRLLIAPGTEVHTFDPKPSDIRAVYDADLFCFIGGESDAWVNTLLKDKSVNTLKMSDCVDLISGHDHHHHEYDEHIWTSPKNASLMVEKICEALCKADPENSEEYKQNGKKYLEKISAADGEIKAVVSEIENPFILVADRFPFLYFAEYYGIDYEAAFGGCAISTDISIKTMSRLVEICEEKNLKYAYFTELSNKNIAAALSEQTGVKLLELHSAHNVTLDDFKSGVTYVDIMRRNMNALKEGMK